MSSQTFSVAGLFMAFVEHFVGRGYDVERAGDLAVESMKAFRKYTGLPGMPQIEGEEVQS